MDGGSIISAACGKSPFAGASGAPLMPSASRSKIHASSTTTSCCSSSISCPCDEDPAFDLKEEDATMSAQTGTVYSMHNIFGPAPSKEEAEEAVSALNLVSFPTIYSQFAGDETISFSEASSSDPSKSSKSILSQAQHKVLNALQLLRVNPSVQSMVVSLSSDKTVWNAVMKNEMVQEFRKSYNADEYLKYVESAVRQSAAQHSNAAPDIVSQILNWILEIAKGQAMRFITDIISLVTKLFNIEDIAANTEIVSDLVRSSFMASILVSFIVILKRIASSY